MTFILVFMVFLITIMIIISAQKKSFCNTFNEVLDGDVLSYQCQNAGIIVDIKNKTVTLFSSNKKSVYSYDEIREINYSIIEAGKIYSTNNSIASMAKTASANNVEKALANKRSGIFVLTDDIINPSWQINLPMNNKSSSSTQQICDRWILIFNKYVFSSK